MRRAGRYFAAVDPNQPRAHFNLLGLYRYHVPAALRRTRNASLAVLLALGTALVVAWIWGSQFSLPPGTLDFSHLSAESFNNAAADFLLPSFTWPAVWWNNTRAVLVYFVTSLFSFGSLAIALIVLPVAPIAFFGALVSNSGFNPLVFIAAFILSHGIFDFRRSHRCGGGGAGGGVAHQSRSNADTGRRLVVGHYGFLQAAHLRGDSSAADRRDL
jgi:hypothetical protein